MGRAEEIWAELAAIREEQDAIAARSFELKIRMDELEAELRGGERERRRRRLTLHQGGRAALAIPAAALITAARNSPRGVRAGAAMLSAGAAAGALFIAIPTQSTTRADLPPGAAGPIGTFAPAPTRLLLPTSVSPSPSSPASPPGTALAAATRGTAPATAPSPAGPSLTPSISILPTLPVGLPTITAPVLPTLPLTPTGILPTPTGSCAVDL
ncbi:MAG TPA: hypothetical protein VL551_13700, partial [Actinospica sp.]|nr:hypothetical protein [Actinospica sp.]